jgi:Flp pilus assembly protein TadB
MERLTTKEVLEKYGKKLEGRLEFNSSRENYSDEYIKFKNDMVPEIGRYEKWAKSLGNFIKLKIAEKDRIKVERHLKVAHLDVTASQALTLAALSMLLVFFLTVLASIAIYFINSTVQILFGLLGLLVSLFVFYYTFTMPQRLANQWRLTASNQMVPAILYVVVYMKHTSNLERAIEFASQHLEGPLALDFKKIFYDVEIGKYSTIKQSLDSYLDFWKQDAGEFVEAFHLIESSLFEPSEVRRIAILEKSLEVILDGVYEKMLRYSREIRSPLTNVYMLGIILPTLGLALLPLATTLLGGVIKWPHVFVIFNIIIPFGVFYLTQNIMLKRPGGYGESSSLENNPLFKEYKSRRVWITAFFVSLPFIIIGLLPFIFQVDFITEMIGLKNDYTFEELGITFLGNIKFFDFKTVGDNVIGPFGPIGVLSSLFLVLGIALFFSTAYLKKTKNLIKVRDDTKRLEEEFTNSLFILGNRLGEGVPAEIAFSRVAETTRGQKTHEFFLRVSKNMAQAGLSLEKAIFDRGMGAISDYPSNLIATSMKILVESVKKGLKVAARSLMSISEYVKNIQKINQRLRDLLAEIVSDMRSNMTFLAPLLAGIVVGLGAMITLILNKLSSISDLGDAAIAGFSAQAITGIFQVTEMIPPYYLQMIVGFYIIEVVFILTGALITVDSGKDMLKETYSLGKNLKSGVLLYFITAFMAVLALTILAGIALSGI